MTSRLERWAEDARAAGHFDEAAVIENQAKVFRKAGVPEDFPPIEQVLAPKDLAEARTRIVGILSGAKIESSRPFSILQVAQEINLKVGQYLADEVEVKDLILPSRTAGTHRNPVEGFEGFFQADPTKVRSAYNRVLNAFSRGRKYSRSYSTLGAIRDTDPKEIRAKGHSVGKVYLAFAKTAFARPQAEKQ